MNRHIIKLLNLITVLSVFALSAWAGAVIERLTTRNGKVYRDVKWGPVNNGKVVAFHSRGVAIIPLGDLPEEYQSQFGATASAEPPAIKPAPLRPVAPVTGPTIVPPPAAPTPVQPPPAPTTSLTAAELRDQLEKMRVHENNTPEGNSWRQYCDERGTVVLLEGKLLDISKLTKITGFVVTAKTRVQSGETWHNATLIELAVKRADAKNVSAAMEMRPALWRSTGEQAWLLNYRPEGDLSGLVRVFGLESTSLEDRRTFLVGREPSFEEWRKLRNK